MGMLLFFQLFHVSLMVHWCMIGPVLHLLLSYPWSGQAVRYDRKQMNRAIFKSLSFCTEDFPSLMNYIFCLYLLQTYFLSSYQQLFFPLLQTEYSEQWALACGEILRVLTHYNRPIYKMEQQNSDSERSNSGCHATTSDSSGESSHHNPLLQQQERKPLRPLSPWITDILLAAPLGIRSDYFRW